MRPVVIVLLDPTSDRCSQARCVLSRSPLRLCALASRAGSPCQRTDHVLSNNLKSVRDCLVRKDTALTNDATSNFRSGALTLTVWCQPVTALITARAGNFIVVTL